MPRRYFDFEPGFYYHIFNRSKTRNTIFLESSDYQRFYDNLVRFQDDFKNLVMVKAFCIMPNHFHLLVYLDPGVDKNVDTLIPNFMLKIQMSYAKYFNAKYSTPGSIREWRYKIKKITDDSYMWAIVNYIQKNSEKHLGIPYTQRKYRSDIKIDNSYEEVLSQIEDYILEI